MIIEIKFFLIAPLVDIYYMYIHVFYLLYSFVCTKFIPLYQTDLAEAKS